MTNDLLTPPAERDLPPGRAIRMRHELLTATRTPRPHTPRWRWVVAAAAALTLLAGLALTAEVRRERTTEIVAMGQSELDPQLRRAAQQCLKWRKNPGLGGENVPLSLGDVAVAARLARGAFGLVTRTDDVRGNAALVSYDSEDREIGRRELFQPLTESDHCYTDPAGTVIYGRPGPACEPADPWER